MRGVEDENRPLFAESGPSGLRKCGCEVYCPQSAGDIAITDDPSALPVENRRPYNWRRSGSLMAEDMRLIVLADRR